MEIGIRYNSSPESAVCNVIHRGKWRKGNESSLAGLLHLLDERLRRRFPFSAAFLALALP